MITKWAQEDVETLNNLLNKNNNNNVQVSKTISDLTVLLAKCFSTMSTPPPT